MFRFTMRRGGALSFRYRGLLSPPRAARSVFRRILRPFRGVRQSFRMLRRVAKNPTRYKHIIDSEFARIQDLFKSINESVLDTNYQVFYQVTGMALTRWAFVEQELVILFSILLQAKPTKAGLILYSTINFNNWLTMIDELFLMEKQFSSFLPRWREIAKKIRSHKDNRDRLAHHPAVPVEEADMDNPNVVSKPPRLDVRLKQKQFKPLSSSEVFDLSQALRSIRGDLEKLTDEMLEHASQEKYRAPNQHQ